jgi:hypothetical protein
VSNETLKCVYYAHFQSIMNYGIILWGHSSRCQRLFRLQKKVIRLLDRAKKRDSCKSLFVQLKILSLSSLYVYRCLEYVMHKRSSVDRAQDVYQHDTRHRTDLYLPCDRLTKSIKHFEYLSPKFYNAIERTVREQPTKVFLAIVKNFLINNALYDYNEFLELVNI